MGYLHHPNAESFAAMREFDAEGRASFASVDALMADSMRATEQSSRFRRDFKRVVASESGSFVRQELSELLLLLASDSNLPERLRDHPLSGEWKGFRDCPLRPDVVLIYRKRGSDHLELARIGSPQRTLLGQIAVGVESVFQGRRPDT